MPDEQRLAVGIDVGQLQVGQLSAADPGRVEHFEHRPVPQPDHRVDVRLGEDLLGFGDAQRRLREPVLQAGQLDLAGGVGQHVPALDSPFEERPDRQQPLRLRMEGQWVTVGLAVVEQVPLIAHQHRPGHLHRPADAALAEPARELRKLLAAVADRGLGVAAGREVGAELLHQRGTHRQLNQRQRPAARTSELMPPPA